MRRIVTLPPGPENVAVLLSNAVPSSARDHDQRILDRRFALALRSHGREVVVASFRVLGTSPTMALLARRGLAHWAFRKCFLDYSTVANGVLNAIS